MVFPYLVFNNGSCQEAFELYGRAFGTGSTQVRKFEGFAPDPAMKEYVMHAEMDLGDMGHISGADALQPVEHGSSSAIIIRTTPGRMRSAWEVLKEGGEVVAPLEPFEIEGNALMGTLKDKYGFTWIFTENS